MAMEPNCIEFLKNKTILVTGATGFLAKVFLEKIMRLQPNVKKLYLLVRACDNMSAGRRLRSEVFENNLFSVLRDNLGDDKLNMLISEKVIPVAGDISMEDLGVKNSDLLENMRREINIVVNSAATTTFDESYEVALGINTFGALNVLNFSKKCVKLEVILHISTAYVCGERSGLILENHLAMGESLNGNNKVDVTTETKLVERKRKQLIQKGCPEEDIKRAMQDLGLQRAKLFGWPNTYVFTKAMGEMLIGYFRQNMPIVIIRPTMITSTLSKPFPGWNEGLQTLDSVIGEYAKGRLDFFPGDLNSVLDIIPADMVANAMLMIATEHSGDTKSHVVYHVGSSRCNPFTIRQFQDFINRYFHESPLIRHNSFPIIVSSFRILDMPLVRVLIFFRHRLPLKILQFISIIFPRWYGDKYIRQNGNMKTMMKMVELYKPYVFVNRIFNDENLDRLKVKIKNNTNEVDGIDPKCIDWEDYFMTTHIPGLVKHVLLDLLLRVCVLQSLVVLIVRLQYIYTSHTRLNYMIRLNLYNI